MHFCVSNKIDNSAIRMDGTHVMNHFKEDCIPIAKKQVWLKITLEYYKNFDHQNTEKIKLIY